MRGPFPGPNHPQFHMGPGHDNMDMPNKFMHPFGHGGRFPMEHGPNGFYGHPGQNPNFHPNGYHMNFGPNGPHGYGPNHQHNMNINHGFGPHGGFNQFEHERRMHEIEYMRMGTGNSNMTSTTASSNAKSPNDKVSDYEICGGLMMFF